MCKSDAHLSHKSMYNYILYVIKQNTMWESDMNVLTAEVEIRWNKEEREG